jgi:S1-C subfamily serine protease
MLYRLLPVCVASILVVGLATGRTLDDQKTDFKTSVAEGKEISLTPVEIKLSDTAEDQGRYTATVKPAKEPKKIKMPAQGWALGFFPKDTKGGGVTVDSVLEGSGLEKMRTEAGKADEVGPWMVDTGDIITHVNGYAVNSAEDIVCATSLAKDKTDVQIVLKDINNGKLLVFYVTATKQ